MPKQILIIDDDEDLSFIISEIRSSLKRIKESLSPDGVLRKFIPNWSVISTPRTRSSSSFLMRSTN